VLGVHANVHAVVPVAGDQVVPPSSDTSTPATVPPPMSPAVPAIVVGVPLAIDAPEAGEVIAEVGACVSGMPGTRSGCSDPAATPMSPN
jgi:hypothetical protein